MRCTRCEGKGRLVIDLADNATLECGKCDGFGTVAEPEADRVLEVRDDAVIDGGASPKVKRIL